MIKVFVNLCHNKPHGKVVNNLFISTPIAYETEHQLKLSIGPTSSLLIVTTLISCNHMMSFLVR